MSEVKADIYTAFIFLKTQIDIDKTKYEKRVENSKKAIAARWEKGKNKKKIRPYTSVLRPYTSVLHNDNGDDNDNVDDNVNVDVNVDVNGDADVNEDAAAEAASKNKDGKEPSAPTAAADKKLKKKELTEGQMNTVVLEFNKYMEGQTIPCVRKMTDKRRELIQAIWQEYSWEDMQRVFRNASYSPFLNGRGKKKFLASFDWIMEKVNFLRILEGSYVD